MKVAYYLPLTFAGGILYLVLLFVGIPHAKGYFDEKTIHLEHGFSASRMVGYAQSLEYRKNYDTGDEQVILTHHRILPPISESYQLLYGGACECITQIMDSKDGSNHIVFFYHPSLIAEVIHGVTTTRQLSTTEVREYLAEAERKLESARARFKPLMKS